jgi:hypothetical protein
MLLIINTQGFNTLFPVNVCIIPIFGLYLHQLFETLNVRPHDIRATPTMNRLFLRLRLTAIDLPDGSVLEIGSFLPVEKGWVVKLKGATNFKGEEGMFEAIHIAKRTTRKIAGWTDGIIEMWDVVEIFQSEDEAMKAAKENENQFIYQIETGTLLRVR